VLYGFNKKPTLSSDIKTALDEANNKFTYQGKPIHPFLIKEFEIWLSDNCNPVTVSVDIGAAAKARNEYSKRDIVIENNRIVVCDDSIVRGTQLKNFTVKKFIEAGAKEIHVRAACPPLMFPCIFNISTRNINELAARKAIKKIEGRDIEDVSEYVDSNSDKYKVYGVIKENIVKHINDNVIYQYRRYYVRENKNNLCPTLTANMGTGGHNVPLVKDSKDIRKLTPKECFIFQGFPQSFKFPKGIANSHLYKQAGNSVTVPVVKRIADQMKKALLAKYSYSYA